MLFENAFFRLTHAAVVIGIEDYFPVRRVYCVGRKYAAYVREIGVDEPEPLFFFKQLADTLAPNGPTVGFPVCTEDINMKASWLSMGAAGSVVPMSTCYCSHASFREFRPRQGVWL